MSSKEVLDIIAFISGFKNSHRVRSANHGVQVIECGYIRTKPPIYQSFICPGHEEKRGFVFPRLGIGALCMLTSLDLVSLSLIPAQVPSPSYRGGRNG